MVSWPGVSGVARGVAGGGKGSGHLAPLSPASFNSDPPAPASSPYTQAIQDEVKVGVFLGRLGREESDRRRRLECGECGGVCIIKQPDRLGRRESGGRSVVGSLFIFVVI